MSKPRRTMLGKATVAERAYIEIRRAALESRRLR